MAKEKAVAKTGSKAIQKGNFSTGFEKPDREIVLIPRVKMIQKTSAEMSADIPFLSFINTINQDMLNKAKKDGATITIIPIKFQKTRLYFRPISEGGGLLCRSFDGLEGVGDPGGKCSGCVMKNWPEEKGSTPPCSDVLNFLTIVRGYESSLPLVTSFAKSSRKAGVQFYNMLLSHYNNNINPWELAFQLSSQSETNDKGTFGVLKVKPNGNALKKEIEMAMKFGELLERMQTEIHEEEEIINEAE